MPKVNNNQPPILPGCSVLPPMESEQAARTHQGSPAKKSGKKATNAKNRKHSTAGRFAVLNEFVDCSLAGLTKSEVVTWLVLYRDTRNGTARTAQADIARRSGLSVRAIQYAMQGLEKRGLLKCVYRGGLNKGPSRFRVLPAVTNKTENP